MSFESVSEPHIVNTLILEWREHGAGQSGPGVGPIASSLGDTKLARSISRQLLTSIYLPEAPLGHRTLSAVKLDEGLALVRRTAVLDEYQRAGSVRAEVMFPVRQTALAGTAFALNWPEWDDSGFGTSWLDITERISAAESWFQTNDPTQAPQLKRRERGFIIEGPVGEGAAEAVALLVRSVGDVARPGPVFSLGETDPQMRSAYLVCAASPGQRLPPGFAKIHPSDLLRKRTPTYGATNTQRMSNWDGSSRRRRTLDQIVIAIGLANLVVSIGIALILLFR